MSMETVTNFFSCDLAKKIQKTAASDDNPLRLHITYGSVKNYSLSLMELISPPDVMMFWMNGGKGCA